MVRRGIGLLLLALIVVPGLAVDSAGHGSTEPPPPPSDPIPPPDRRKPPRNPARPPEPPGEPPEIPGGPTPTTPSGDDPLDPFKPPPERGPPPTPQPSGPGTDPRDRIRDGLRPGGLERRFSPRGDSWRLWWEYNREHLVGLRSRVRERIVLTGRADPRALDPLGERRPEVVATLSSVARGDRERDVRASALVALGRLGGDAEARLVLEVLGNRREPDELREAAAVAFGLFAHLEDGATRAAARDFVRWAFDHPERLPLRAHGMLVLAAGLRARDDATLRMELIGRAAGRSGGSEAAAHVALALGLADSALAAPELIDAARTGRLGREDLSDVGRSMATAGLARLDDPAAGDALVRVLQSRRTGMQTRRAAALGLGRLLREGEADDALRARARRALLRTLDKGNDVALRGYAAVAMGGARPPIAIPALQDALDHGGAAEVKPYLALGLGLAAGTLGPDRGRALRRFLADELDKTNQADLEASLSIAIGLAGANEAGEALLDLLRTTRNTATVRGAAAQGLGLLTRPPADAVEELEKTLAGERGGDLLAEAALALGLMGRRGIVPKLCEMLPSVRSAAGQGKLMLALGHLSHSGAVEPLLAILRDERQIPTVREFAAVALGMLGSRHEVDPLFDLDAWHNLHATTTASNEMLRLY